MTITIKVNPQAEPVISEKLKMIVRRTVDGNLIIDDHPVISIVVNPDTKTITAYPKNSFGDEVYYYQDLLFRKLCKKGIVTRASVNAGSAYCSLEGQYPETNDNINLTHLVLLNISKFILEVKPDLEFDQWLEKEQEKMLTEPSDEYSTELGEVPAKTNKGVIDPTNRIRRYMGGYYSY